MQLAVLILKYGGASIAFVTIVRKFPLIIAFSWFGAAKSDSYGTDNNYGSRTTNQLTNFL